MFAEARIRPLALLLLSASCNCDDAPLFEARAELVVTPARLEFGEVLRGEFRVRALKLANVGTAPLAIRRLEVRAPSGEFMIVSTPPAGLLGNQSIDLSVVYEPEDLGLDRADLLIESDDGASPMMIPLEGTGVGTGARVEGEPPACPGEGGSMAFGEVAIGDRAARTIVVTATGAAEIRVVGTRVESTSGEWTIDAITSPVALAPGASLSIGARFAPVDAGAERATFVVETDPPAQVFRIPACGAGAGPALCGRPVPLDLGLVAVGGVVTATLTLESCGTRPLALQDVAIANDAQHPSHRGIVLAGAPRWPTVLAPGTSIAAPIRFAATAIGPAMGWLRADSDAAGLPRAFFPILARAAEPCDVFVAPAALRFDGVAVGATEQRAALVANGGASDCTVERVEVATGTATFGLVRAPSTPFVLGPGASEILSVEYRPSGAPDHGRLEIESGGAISPIELSGNPPEVSECAIEIVPSVVDFGVVALGTSARRAVAVRPIGGEACRLDRAVLSIGNSDFALTPPTSRIILPFRSASIDLGFTPSRAGASAERLELTVSALGGGTPLTYSAGLFGAGSDARICVVPTDLRFGTVPIGGFAERPVQIANCGSAGLAVRGLVISQPLSGPFSIRRQPALPHRLAGGAAASPELLLRYAPTGPGPHFGQLDVLSTDPRSPTVPVTLSGDFDGGCARVLDCSPRAIAFGPTELGTTRTERLRCRSAGTATVTISALTLSAGASELSILASTPVSLPRGASWTADLVYTPASTSSISATLQIVSDACLGGEDRAISGHGRRSRRPPCLPPSSFSPVTQWEWSGSTTEPMFKNVWMTPIVASLTDDDGDGRIDDRDIPDVLVTTFDILPLATPSDSMPGILRVLSGDTGREHFSVLAPRIAESAQLAVGDLDADGRPEIIASQWTRTPTGTGAGSLAGKYRHGRLIALDHTGRLLWESDEWSWPDSVLWNASSPAIADLDADGFAEIVLGREVFDHRGRLRWRGTGGHGLSGAGPQSVVADLDLDGRPEVIAGNTAYRADGTVLWQAMTATGRRVPEGGASVGMLDPNDPYPQIALDGFNELYALDHHGVVAWSVPLANRGPTSALPVIADFDGDGDPDIAVADGEAVRVFTGTGQAMWSAPASDMTCCPGISAFDFEGDGAYELLLNDFGTVYVFRGATGARIFSAPRLNVTNYEIPVVADVDGDGRAEIIVALNNGRAAGGGVRVYSNTLDNWVAAPRIWNQQAYHVTNVSESGAIPRRALPVPQAPKVFRATAASCE